MGWGAAYALAEEWADWCSGPEEAYEILYGNHKGNEQCPVCGNRFKSVNSVIQHARAKHKRAKHQTIIEAYIARARDEGDGT